MLGLVLVIATSACDGEALPQRDPLLDEGRRYLYDYEYRQRALVESLVNPDNGYAQLRLRSYNEEDWGQLPTFNPLTRAVTAADLGADLAGVEVDEGWEKIGVDEVPLTRDSLVDLGRQAFFEYPMAAHYMRAGIASAQAADRYGLWRSPSGQLGGLRFVAQNDGSVGLAMTCATCHAGPARGDDAGPIIEGLANGRLDVGAMIRDAGAGIIGPRSAWGPGRMDVTPDEVDNPTAISDLRPIVHQTHLHRAATLRHSLVSLAIRIETLLITSMREGRRPPRVLALAIAMYLWSLAPEADRDETKGEGQAVFERACSGCHQEPTYTGPPVEIGAVGTDPAVAQSPSRGTGTWRVPSLLGVSDRALLTSSGAFTTLEELLDPTRRQGGHLFGLDLSEADRRSLLRHLDTL